MALHKTPDFMRCLQCTLARLAAHKNMPVFSVLRQMRCFSFTNGNFSERDHRKSRKPDTHFLDTDNYGKDSEMKFVDWVKIKIEAGNGGDGLAHLKRGRSLMGPDGGDGGNGGSVFVMADNSYRHLKLGRRHFKAMSGGKGQVDNCRGKDGKHVIIKVPPGTVVKESGTDDILADLASHGCSSLIAKGGTGGLGNMNFKNSVDQRTMEFTPGTEGDSKTVELEMKSIADIGLVGFPNAGKSTLLRALSRAKPAVAAYPFTTLKPNIGVIEYSDHVQISVADIPGLVEDAHVNKGLGHSFLRHIERCSSLLYVVDLSDGDVIKSFQTLQREVELYNPKLVHLPSAVVANKVDIVENHEARIAEAEGVLSCPVIAISGKHLNNIDNLRSLIRDIYENRLNSLNQRK